MITLMLLLQAAFGQLSSNRMMKLSLDIKTVSPDAVRYDYSVSGFPAGHARKLYFGVAKQGQHVTASDLVDGSLLCEKISAVNKNGRKELKMPCSIEKDQQYTLWAAMDEDAQGTNPGVFGNRDFALPSGSMSSTQIEMHTSAADVRGFNFGYSMTGHKPGGMLYVAVSKKMSGYTAAKINDEQNPDTVCWAAIRQKEGEGNHHFKCSLEPGTHYKLYTALSDDSSGSGLHKFQSAEFSVQNIAQAIMITQKNLNTQGFDFTYQMQNVIKGGRIYVAVTRKGDHASPEEISNGGGSVICSEEFRQIDENDHTKRIPCSLEPETHYILWIAGAIDASQGGLHELTREPFFVPDETEITGMLGAENVDKAGFDLLYQINNHVPNGLVYFAVTEDGVKLTPQQIAKDESPVLCFTTYGQVDDTKHKTPWACPLKRQTTYILWMATANDVNNSFLKTVTHVKFKIKEVISTAVWKEIVNQSANGFDLNYRLKDAVDGGEVCFSAAPSNIAMNSKEVSKDTSKKAYCHVCVDQTPDGIEHTEKVKCHKKLEIGHMYILYAAVSDAQQTEWQMAGNKGFSIQKIIQTMVTHVSDVNMKGFTLHYSMSGSNKGGKIYYMVAEECPEAPEVVRRVKDGTDLPSGVLRQEDDEDHEIRVRGHLRPNTEYKVCVVLDPDGSETQLQFVENAPFQAMNTERPTPQPTPQPIDRTCTEGLNWSMTGEEPCEPCKRCGRYQATTFWCTVMRDSECEDLCPLAPDCSCQMGFVARMRKSDSTGCAECTCEAQEPPTVEPGSTSSSSASAAAAAAAAASASASASAAAGASAASASSSSEGEGEGASAGASSSGGASASEGAGENSGGCGDDDDDDDDDCDEGSRLASRSSRLSMFGRGEAKWIGVYVLAGVATFLTLALLVKYFKNRGKYNGDHVALDHLLAHDTQL